MCIVDSCSSYCTYVICKSECFEILQGDFYIGPKSRIKQINMLHNTSMAA